MTQQKDGRKPLMCEQDIAARLINWGMCQRGRSGGAMVARETRRSSPYGGQGYQCMTAVVCGMLKAAAKGPSGGIPTQSRLDFGDASTINLAWQKLSPRHRLLLRDLYVLDRPVYVICRELNIRHWPGIHWNRELAVAQQAIEAAVQ